MTRARPALFVGAACAALLAAVPAGAASSGGIEVRYPSGLVPDPAALFQAISDPSVGTVVFEKGVNPFSAPIFVFRREGLVLRGATKNAADTVIQSSASVAFAIDESSRITFRDMTIRSTATFGEGVRLLAVRSSFVDGFAREVAVRNCRVEGAVPLRGTVGAMGLDVADCTLTVTVPGGIGIFWEDGPVLLVTRTRFGTADFTDAADVANSAILVRGAQFEDSEGQRARSVILTRNQISGNFASGLDLVDVTDTRVLRNQITFPSATYGPAAAASGRVGMVVRLGTASQAPDDFALRNNRVRNAHTGVWCQYTASGEISSNDLRGCGTPQADTRFVGTGGALRIDLAGPSCALTVRGNDFRGLHSPAGAPAVVTTPAEGGSLCFDGDGEQTDQDVKNRLDPGRRLYQ